MRSMTFSFSQVTGTGYKGPPIHMSKHKEQNKRIDEIEDYEKYIEQREKTLSEGFMHGGNAIKQYPISTLRIPSRNENNITFFNWTGIHGWMQKIQGGKGCSVSRAFCPNKSLSDKKVALILIGWQYSLLLPDPASPVLEFDRRDFTELAQERYSKQFA